MFITRLEAFLFLNADQVPRASPRRDRAKPPISASVPPSVPGADWRRVRWPHLGHEDAWLDEAWALHGRTADRHLPNIVDWAQVNTRGHDTTLLLFERRIDGALRSYAVAELGREHIDVSIGLRILRRQHLDTIKIVGGAVSDDPNLSPAAALGDLLRLLRGRAPSLSLHLHALPPEVMRELQAARATRGMLRLPEGRMQHYRLDMPASAESLFAIFDGRTRSSIRRHLRRLDEKCGPGRLRLESFSQPAEVDRFLDIAIDIARETYQHQLLGIGVASNERRHEWLMDIAAAGWWRGHLLWCGDQAVAFLVSARVGDVQYGLEMGYDPLWAEWSVGTVALVEMIRSLIEGDNPPASLDFLYGDQDYKRRLSTDAWEEESAFLLPLSALGLVHYAVLAGGQRAIRFGARQLQRLGLKQAVKQYLRAPALPPAGRDNDGPR